MSQFVPHINHPLKVVLQNATKCKWTT